MSQNENEGLVYANLGIHGINVDTSLDICDNIAMTVVLESERLGTHAK